MSENSGESGWLDKSLEQEFKRNSESARVSWKHFSFETPETENSWKHSSFIIRKTNGLNAFSTIYIYHVFRIT